jgi:hypothetical protein
MGAKILMNTDSNENASNKLDTLLISEINTSDELQHRFIFETLIGPQGTSIVRRSPRVSRIPYKSGQLFSPF